MARTTESLVRRIIEVDDTIAPDLDPFVETAHAMVNAVCTGFDPAYTETQLELIERWLAAHFYGIRDTPRAREAAGSVSENFQYKIDLGLDQTRHGQMAKVLDFKGGLAQLDKKVKDGTQGKTASVNWAGTEYD